MELLSPSSSRQKLQVGVNKWRFQCDFCAICCCDIAEVWNMFETWCNLASVFGKSQQTTYSNCREIVMKSPLVYTCDKSCIGEHNKNCIKNCMCKQAFMKLWLITLIIIIITFGLGPQQRKHTFVFNLSNWSNGRNNVHVNDLSFEKQMKQTNNNYMWKETINHRNFIIFFTILLVTISFCWYFTAPLF